MNSDKNLFEAECGQPNALVRLGRQVFQDASSGQQARRLLGPLQPTARPEDEFTQEYLAQFGGIKRRAPATFSMHGILEEVNRLEHAGPSTTSAAAWSREYFSALPPIVPSQQWTDEYLHRESTMAGPVAIYNEAWKDASMHPPELKWSAEYLADAEKRSAFGITDRAASQSMLDGIPDDAQLWNTEFMQFMQKVDRGEVKIDGDRVVEPGVSTSEKELSEGAENFWDKLESEWDDLSRNSESHRWLAEYDSISSMYKTYNMAEENPYLDAEDPLSLGKRYLSEGNLANAILCFEASVQRQPDSSEAWLCLARAQAENEQEARAISAANKCLELEPGRLDALATLSTAYANESLYDSSCRALAQWLAAHPMYKSFAPADIVDNRRPIVSSFMNESVFTSVEKAFLDAARSNTTVDPELQNCFGVLYNLTGDTERAIDCFQTALMIRPDDARLWNRLGATLANGGRSAEAISAYRKALELYPGFVRARYNLGISCLNLGARREAIDHFLSALSLQMRGVGPADKSMMSDGIWSTLRVAVMGLKREDCLGLVDNRDFDQLKQLFGSGILPDSVSVAENPHMEHVVS